MKWNNDRMERLLFFRLIDLFNFFGRIDLIFRQISIGDAGCVLEHVMHLYNFISNLRIVFLMEWILWSSDQMNHRHCFLCGLIYLFMYLFVKTMEFSDRSQSEISDTFLKSSCICLILLVFIYLFLRVFF